MSLAKWENTKKILFLGGWAKMRGRKMSPIHWGMYSKSPKNVNRKRMRKTLRGEEKLIFSILLGVVPYTPLPPREQCRNREEEMKKETRKWESTQYAMPIGKPHSTRVLRPPWHLSAYVCPLALLPIMLVLDFVKWLLQSVCCTYIVGSISI